MSCTDQLVPLRIARLISRPPTVGPAACTAAREFSLAKHYLSHSYQYPDSELVETVTKFKRDIGQ